MTDLVHDSATELARLIATGSVTCTEVMTATLEQSRRLQPKINAFALLDADGALAAAKRADAVVRSGDPLGPLHGVPFSVKDLIDVKGLETGCGSWLMEGSVAGDDAESVRRLRSAGALLIGKTTTPEFAGSVLTESLRHGITANPWNTEHTPGGSSGGAGAAVASGCAPLGLATDGAGSARIPASCCGVLGLKPTLGRVPHPQAPDLFSNFTHIGLMTRTLPDLASMLNVLSGPHDGDPWSLGAQWEDVDVRPSVGARLRGTSAWYFPRMGNPRVASEVETLCVRAAQHLAETGVVVEDNAESLDWGIGVSRTIMRGLMSARMSQFDAKARARMGPGMQAAITQGEGMSAEAMKRAPLLRAQLYRMVQTLLARHPLLLSPTLSAPAPRADMDSVGELVVDGINVGDLRSGWFTYPTPFNLTGHPALSIPVGFTTAGLPVGLHAVAGWGQEQLLLDVAAALQDHFDWSKSWPVVA
ncbi:MAG: amidase [Chromatiales bacterium]|nr:amidase [Chromatiales bacterium]